MPVPTNPFVTITIKQKKYVDTMSKHIHPIKLGKDYCISTDCSKSVHTPKIDPRYTIRRKMKRYSA